ncbi:MAG TPA: glycoside hydrolase family 16 protein [Candidatus Paceibacterota bacterium]|nr:glycoside hydrolase family 16 protein [Verrucomicrobiota bacterium]HSA08880.1 glycoside hydrolase family 16 protein [Candidatus Paceibacterota bacterium]
MSKPLLAIVFCLTVLATGVAAEEKASPPKGWKLVWRDEFNGRKLNPKKWNVLLRERSKHNELQYYVPDEVYLENGCLRLRSRVRDYGAMHYTSGRVDTRGKLAPVYGRFEIRARLPGGKGLWPAHWLYPQNRDWPMERLMAEAVANGNERLIPEARPWYSEIDIMEFLGHEPNIVYGTLHYHTFEGQKKTSSVTWKADTDFSKYFHVYALEWQPDMLRWFLDGRLIHTTTNGIPHTPHYLILNTAVGGQWPGNPDATTTFPQFHDIDYVRVYQRDGYFSR